MSAREVQMITVQAKAGELLLQFAGVHPEVQQGADEHVSADPAEQIKVQSFHGQRAYSFAAKALIWLAA